MGSTFTIGKLAESSGLASSAIRYYEGHGLIEPIARTESNYRLFGPESLSRLRFIQAAKLAGFTLDDIRRLIEIRGESRSPCSDVKRLVGKRREELKRKLRELENAQAMLDSYIDLCEKTTSIKHCDVLDVLEHCDDQNCTV